MSFLQAESRKDLEDDLIIIMPPSNKNLEAWGGVRMGVGFPAGEQGHRTDSWGHFS